MPGVDLLRSSENAASRPLESGIVSDAPRSSIYTGTGKSGSASSTTGRFSLKGKKKGLAAIISIVFLMVGGGAFLGSSNTLLAPAIEALFTSATNTQNASSKTLSATIIRYALRNNGSTNTGEVWEKPYKNISEQFSKQLSSNGIEVDGNTLKYGDEIIDADNFMNSYNNNYEFRGDIIDSRYGNIIDYYDTPADDAFQDINISRNIFRDYNQTGDTEADDVEFRNTISDDLSGSSTDITTTKQKREEYETTVTNEDGTTSTETSTRDVYEPNKNTSKIDTDDTMEAATIKANSYLSSIAKVSDFISWGCTAMKVASLVSSAIAAMEMYQSYSYFMGMIENVSKMKAGYGDESAINSFLNFMTTSATTTIEDYSQSVKFNGNNYQSAQTSLDTKTETGTPLEASGVQMIMSGAPANLASLQNYSLERTSKSVFSALAMTGTTAAACAVSDATGSIISLATTFASGGLSVIGGYALKLGFGLTATYSIGAFLSFLVPTLARTFFIDPLKEAIGIPGGETFARGAGVNLQLAQSANGQAFASKSNIAQYNRLNNQVAALDAEVDRLNRSPFDITSKNTFLGSIAYSLLPILTSGTTSTLSSLIRTTAKSLGSLTGNVSAEGEGSSYLTTHGDCPQLAEVGGDGTVYCNSITISDPSMFNVTIDDQQYWNFINANVDCNRTSGKCKINENGVLAKKITVCDKRLSPPGVYDANIANLFEVGNGFTGAIPVVGDIINLINSTSALANRDWITGERCGFTEQNSRHWNNEMKYAQHFVQEQRILEQMGAFDDGQSLVSAYIEEYNAKHPTDNSPSGVLARITGMSTEDADLVLAVVDYYQFLNEYDASTRIAMTDKASEPDTSTIIIAHLEAETSPIINNHQPIVQEDNTPVILIADNYLYFDNRETLRDRSLVA